MTKYTEIFTIKRLARLLYRPAIVVYIIYFILSPYALAEQANAPDQKEAGQLAMVEPAAFVDNEIIQAIIGIDVDLIEDNEHDDRADKIAAYYGRYNLPLGDHADAFVEAADRYGIDWRLVAAIGFIESTGGKNACSSASYSPFGWGSCKINFESYEEAIDVVSKNLGGHNPSTEHFYKGKNLTEVLYAYNSVIPNYRQKILREMDIIDNQKV